MGQDSSTTTLDPLLAAIGARLFGLRRAAGLSRRALSIRADISERYLAQLEGGTGNASVSVLARLAEALDTPLGELLAEPDPLVPLLRKATLDQRTDIARILGPGKARDGRIALVGLRGAGKSTLGPLLAARLGLPFRELNAEIAQDAGMPAGEVMALYGEAAYRRRERAALERLAEGPPLVLTAAGGIVADAETYNLLLAQFLTIWLRATPEEHMTRVRAQGDERPMQGNPQAMAELRAILDARTTAYARARLMVDTSGRTPQQILKLIQTDLRPLITRSTLVRRGVQAPESE